MSKSKYVLVSLVAVGALTVATITGVGAVKAADALDDYPGIIQKIAERFELNPEEVQVVFEEQREERHAAHTDKLIEDGTLTEEQAEMLEAKREEMRSEMEALRSSGLSRDEMREIMEDHREEMDTWAEENGIDLPERQMGMRKGMGGGFGEMGGHMMELEIEES